MPSERSRTARARRDQASKRRAGAPAGPSRSITPMLGPLVDAWRLSADLHRLRSGASESELAVAEDDLGRPLPEPVRALYRLTDGASFLDGNLNVYPLQAETLGLVGASDWLRSVRWTIAEELVVFGDNGSDDS